MRSPHWEYLGLVLVGIGAALVISGAVALFYFQFRPDASPQYHSYPLPLLITGAFLTAIGAVALIQARAKKHKEDVENALPPPPPPLLPPPPD